MLEGNFCKVQRTFGENAHANCIYKGYRHGLTSSNLSAVLKLVWQCISSFTGSGG